jgi:hypothetical protein
MKKAAENRRPLYSRIPGCLFGRLRARRVERAGVVDFGGLAIAEAEDLAEDFVGVLTKQRGAGHFARAIRQLDRIADRDVLAAGRVIDLDHGAGGAQRLVFGDLLHRRDRAAGDVVLEDFHRLELGHA